MTGFYAADEAGFELPVLSTHTPAEAVTVNLGARHRHRLTYDKLSLGRRRLLTPLCWVNRSESTGALGRRVERQGRQSAGLARERAN